MNLNQIESAMKTALGDNAILRDYQVEQKYSNDSFPVTEFSFSAYSPEFGLNQKTEKRKSSKSKHTMKDPNNNKVTHEISRELVAATVAESKASSLIEKCEAKTKAARDSVQDAHDKGGALVIEAEKALAEAKANRDQNVSDAKARVEEAKVETESARTSRNECEANVSSAKAGLVAIRAASDEDIYLTVGTHTVTAYEVEDDEEAYEVDVAEPTKVPKA